MESKKDNAVRKIIHVDMDAFFASIEQRDNPAFRGKPLAVGHGAERGVVAAASYEARKYGVRSAMPSITAMAKCPELIFTPSRFDVYSEVSGQIREIFLEYTDLVEPLSLDEAYLDLTVNRSSLPYATSIAKEIKTKIKQGTGLTASAGVSINKFLAKIASDYRKTDGLFVIPPEKVEAFVEGLKIERFWGVGKVTANKMHSLGIFTGKDLKSRTEIELVQCFGKAGHDYYLNARGIDNREVVPDRIRKSLGAESTFSEDIDDKEQLLHELNKIAEEVWERVTTKDFYGRTVTLKVKYEDFEQITRQKTYVSPIKEFSQLWRFAEELLDLVDLHSKKVRLIGLSVSNADTELREQYARQLYLEFGEDDIVDMSVDW
jgi:DNA polymerase-4